MNQVLEVIVTVTEMQANFPEEDLFKVRYILKETKWLKLIQIISMLTNYITNIGI